MVTTKLNLSMTEPSARQIYAKQGDTGRVLDIALDQTPEDGTLRILRPDGVEVTSEAVTGGEVESGSTFESLTEADVTELTVGIEPVQDLNGYDKPWVGGAGKNKLPLTVATVKASSTAGTWSNNAYTINGVTFTLNTDAYGNLVSISTSGTASDVAPLVLARNISFASGSYILTGAPSGGGSSKWELALAGGASDFGSGGNFTSTGQTITASAIYIYNGQSASGLVFYPMLVASTETDSTFAPYSNICPITGWDSVTVNRTGKNLLNVETSGTVVSNGITFTVLRDSNGKVIEIDAVGTSTNITLMPLNSLCKGVMNGRDYTMTSGISDDGFGKYGVQLCNVVNSATIMTTTNGAAEVRLPSGMQCYARIVIWGGQTVDLKFKPMIRLASVIDATYEPYAGQVYDITLPTEAGTVYGGTLDVTSGVLTVDRAMVDLGSLTWTKDTSLVRFYAYVNGAKPPASNSDAFSGISSAYNSVSLNSLGVNTGDGLMALSTGADLSVRDLSLMSLSATDFKTAVTGRQLVFELATPQTYTLTAQQIKTLVGTNNVWASSGDIVSIKFTYGGLLSELPSDATSVVGKCYCDIEQNGVSSMPFALNVKKNERAT